MAPASARIWLLHTGCCRDCGGGVTVLKPSPLLPSVPTSQDRAEVEKKLRKDFPPFANSGSKDFQYAFKIRVSGPRGWQG